MVITLPRNAIKDLSKEYVKIDIPENKLTPKEVNQKVLEAAYGILKDLKLDALKYQERIRSEWDRR